MVPQEIRIPDSELQVLQALWEKGPSTAREIRETIDEARGGRLAHATVVTLIQRLEEKGYIKRTGKQVGKAFVYRASLKPERAQQHFVQKYLTRAFGGDPIPLFSQLIESEDLSLDEIVRIREMLDERERRMKEKG